MSGVDQFSDVFFMDVNLSILWFEIINKILKEFIFCNVYLFVEKLYIFVIVEDDQLLMVVDIYEGEGIILKENFFFGIFGVVDIFKFL